MPTCKYERHDYKCEYDGDPTTGDGFCILHSPNPEKDQGPFEQALTAHRKIRVDSYVGFVFPASHTFLHAEFTGNAKFDDAKFTGKACFQGAKFTGEACFQGAKFTGEADFWIAEFGGQANFEGAEFSGSAGFLRAKFSGDAVFRDAQFSGGAVFSETKFARRAVFERAKFSEEALFGRTKFSEEADFRSAMFNESASFWIAEFSEEALFEGAEFSGSAGFFRAKFSGEADFRSDTFSGKTEFTKAKFLSRTLFVSGKEHNKIIQIFSLTKIGAEIDFTDVIIERPEALIFRDADLSKCRFLSTDLRKAEITNAKWSEFGGREGVYDEHVLIRNKTDDWAHVESLYRQLKQNYEDRKDYERARDFHYGEKEMRRKNPKTSRGLCFLLTLYWAVSGYGERFLRPFISLGIVLLISMTCYLSPWFELKLKLDTGTRMLDWTSGWGWLESFHYTLRTMLLLKPEEVVCSVK